MIISESNDISTNKVLEWLEFYNKIVERKNVDTHFEKISIQITNDSTFTNFNNSIIWNRRGYLPIIPLELKKSNLISYLKKEQLVVINFFEFNNIKKLYGSYIKEINNNKLYNLHIARLVGLKIPSTLVTNNKSDLNKFKKQNKKYITKSISLPPIIELSRKVYFGNGTTELNFNNISDTFAPSLVQEYIEKEIEIRIFFIDNYYYSMAIFSQNDEKTKIDYRNYNIEKPNRIVPFTIEEKILKKIMKFTKKIKINTGSIDLILTPKGEYFFLEINPMGQYDWLSEGCNYYIDKKIAEFLIEKNNL